MRQRGNCMKEIGQTSGGMGVGRPYGVAAKPCYSAVTGITGQLGFNRMRWTSRDRRLPERRGGGAGRGAVCLACGMAAFCPAAGMLSSGGGASPTAEMAGCAVSRLVWGGFGTTETAGLARVLVRFVPRLPAANSSRRSCCCRAVSPSTPDSFSSRI